MLKEYKITLTGTFFSNKFKKSFVNQKNTVLLHRFSPLGREKQKNCMQVVAFLQIKRKIILTLYIIQIL